MYIHYFTRLCDYSLHILLLNMTILELLACGWCWCKLVHPVPMLTLDWLCHSLLLFEVFIDAFTCIPWGRLAWLPQFRCVAQDFLFNTCTCCYKVNYHTHSWISDIYINIYTFFIHIDHVLARLRRMCICFCSCAYFLLTIHTAACMDLPCTDISASARWCISLYQCWYCYRCAYLPIAVHPYSCTYVSVAVT